MNALYEVYETDADDSMEPAKLQYTGVNRDLAESKMVLLFGASGYSRDYLLYNVTGQEIVSACLTPATQVRRGICQG